jgi:hypothetical protein
MVTVQTVPADRIKRFDNAIVLPRLWLLAAFGFAIGGFLDFLHTVTGTIVYPEGGIHPARVLSGCVLFSAAYPLMGYCSTRVVAALGGHQRRPARFDFAAVGVFAVGYGLTAFGAPLAGFGTHAIAAVLAAAGVFYWRAGERSWQVLVGALLLALAGTTVEAGCAAAGLMTYVAADYGLFVPVWLPTLYFLGSLTVGPMFRRILVIR